MGEWSDREKQDFIHHYQKTHLKGNDPNNLIKCQYKRQSIHLMLNAAQKVSSNEATCHILKMKLCEYSALVDKQDGVNNYANGVLDLVSQSSNDAQTWTSSADASELLKKFLKPLPGKCENKCDDGCKAQKPTLQEFTNFLNNKKPFENSLYSLSKPEKPPVKKTSKSFGSNIQETHVAATSSKMQPQSGRVSSRAGNDSKLMNAIGGRVFGTEKSSGINQPLNHDHKHKVPSFRTAGTELKLQNAKKHGQKAGTSKAGEERVAYGCGKKSLGGRTRSVNSKFVPPVKSDSQSEEDGLEPQEEEDERLRLIDPKIIELVRSEIMDHGPPVHWDDIAGLQFAKSTIQEIVVLPMLRPDIFTGLRRPPKGILLFGPPGTGKTLIGKCVASQSKSTFFNISASSLTSKWVGEGEKMVRTLFTLARIHQPAVVFIDEIDSLLSQRSESDHESSRRIKTEFLVQLDGAGTGEDDRILVIGATNRPQELDEAARRRLVKRLYIPLPDRQARCQIVRNLMSGERNELSPSQVEEIADLTEGYSGADMKVVCQEACLGPIRAISFADMQLIQADQVRPVTIGDFTASLACVRSSVSPDDLEVYINWDKTYGSGGAPK